MITVRLATGAHTTVLKVPLNSCVKLLDFDSIQRCLVLGLDSRYDRIGTIWLERHKPCIIGGLGPMAQRAMFLVNL